MTKKVAAGIMFTTLSRARTCAPTASVKYTVNIAVVNRATPGNRDTDSKPRAAAALTTGRTHRISGGTRRSSRVFAMYGNGIAHATASPALKAASAR